MRFAPAAVLLTLALLAARLPAQEAAAPGILDVKDKVALEANQGKAVIVEGEVEKAEWSNSGKVMTVTFKGTEQSKFVAVAFVRIRHKLDASFGPDAAVSFTGKRLRISGKLRTYEGDVQKFAGRLEMTISEPNQVTVMEPTTKPTEQ